MPDSTDWLCERLGLAVLREDADSPNLGATVRGLVGERIETAALERAIALARSGTASELVSSRRRACAVLTGGARPRPSHLRPGRRGRVGHHRAKTGRGQCGRIARTGQRARRDCRLGAPRQAGPPRSRGARPDRDERRERLVRSAPHARHRARCARASRPSRSTFPPSWTRPRACSRPRPPRRACVCALRSNPVCARAATAAAPGQSCGTWRPTPSRRCRPVARLSCG